MWIVSIRQVLHRITGHGVIIDAFANPLKKSRLDRTGKQDCDLPTARHSSREVRGGEHTVLTIRQDAEGLSQLLQRLHATTQHFIAVLARICAVATAFH